MGEINVEITEDTLNAIRNVAELLAFLDAINDRYFISDTSQMELFYAKREKYEFCEVIKNYVWDEI